MNLNCLLINSDGKLILVDNGLGDKLTAKEARNWALEYPQGTLIESLSALGISTMDINIVINTHLHSDHCGGNTQFSDGRIEVTFPQAEYWVQRLEWADAMHPDLRTRNTYLEWQAWAVEHDALLIFQHDSHTPLGKLIKDDRDGLNIHPVSHPALSQLSIP
jgi:glyoxylase-like metal-dependent hydrolase (beta-lactamase superfamily II)